jgi:hypothetical protein
MSGFFFFNLHFGISFYFLELFFIGLVLHNQYSELVMGGHIFYFNVHLFLWYNEGKEHCSQIRPKVLSTKIVTLHL